MLYTYTQWGAEWFDGRADPPRRRRRCKLDEINEAIQDLRDGRNMPGVNDFNAWSWPSLRQLVVRL